MLQINLFLSLFHQRICCCCIFFLFCLLSIPFLMKCYSRFFFSWISIDNKEWNLFEKRKLLTRRNFFDYFYQILIEIALQLSFRIPYTTPVRILSSRSFFSCLLPTIYKFIPYLHSNNKRDRCSNTELHFCFLTFFWFSLLPMCVESIFMWWNWTKWRKRKGEKKFKWNTE